MAVKATVNNKDTYYGNSRLHAEDQIIHNHREGNLTIEMDAWPCWTGAQNTARFNCHNKLAQASRGRKIELKITGDIGNYSQSHGHVPPQLEGQISYHEGEVKGDTNKIFHIQVKQPRQKGLSKKQKKQKQRQNQTRRRK